MSDNTWTCSLCGERHLNEIDACPGEHDSHSKPMTQVDFGLLLEEIHRQELEVRDAGQSEYAHDLDNAHANFDRLASALGLSPEQVLWVYLQKHMDGILAWINGHKSQREDVRGRIKDARCYLALLWGMVERGER